MKKKAGKPHEHVRKLENEPTRNLVMKGLNKKRQEINRKMNMNSKT